MLYNFSAKADLSYSAIDAGMGAELLWRLSERLWWTCRTIGIDWPEGIRMTTRRAMVLVLFLAVGCQQATVSVDEPASAAEEVAGQADSDTQLRINTEALLAGASEDIRVDAATIMLFSDNPYARRTLLDVLEHSDNVAARAAVCKALSVARGMKKPLKDKGDFIGPLVDVLRTEDVAGAKMAAEAALLFDYKEIAEGLEKTVKDKTLPVRARLNTIYALKLQLDIKAISQLMDLLDDKDMQISSAAAEALRSIGIPAGRDPRTRKQILAELRDKGMERFQRDWLVRQEAKVSELERERNLWRKLYMGALDKIYAGISDDAEKGKFLIEYLGNAEPTVRLWSLDKVSQWRLGAQSKLPAELGAILVKLISDENRDVRLGTAKLLSLMSELNSAERLLQQLSVEQDDEVKTEMFVALGGACQYAFRPNSGIQLPAEIRKQTLELAAVYLREQDAGKSQRGAEVIRKLLEPEGLSADAVDGYLGLLADRYEQARSGNDKALRGELLNVMAGLCAQSAYKAESSKRFLPLFENAIHDETDLVREAAVEGLANIDKTRAMKLLRKDFVNDRSSAVRKRLIALAAEVGGDEDLVWLSEKVGSNSESEPAWQAMMRIFNDSDGGVVSAWLNKFETEESPIKLSDEQRVLFLELAERKVGGENNGSSGRIIQQKLAQTYTKTGQYERAAAYLALLRQSAQSPAEKEAVLASLLEVYLQWPKVEAAGQLVGNCLLEKDLSSNNAVVQSLDRFFNSATAAVDPNAVFEALTRIKMTDPRPLWQEQLKRWGERYRSGSAKGETQAGGGLEIKPTGEK